MKKGLSILAAVALTFATSAALAHVIDPADGDAQKAAAKLRKDIAGQVSKYTFCLVKAASKCEKKGVSSASECNIATGLFSNEVNEPGTQAKFQAAIAKCDDKLVLTKKGTDYTGIGCPGDCGAAPGTQSCLTVAAFETNVEGTSTPESAKNQLGTLAGLIDFGCSLDHPMVPATDEVRIDCVNDQAKLLSKYASAVFKCQAKCENDYKNKIGNGGFGNGAECLAPGPGPVTEPFTACIKKSADKILPELGANVATILPLLQGVINDATVGLYDRDDPTSGDPEVSPCGNCGNGTREGAEECDLADDILCGGPCNADCTCP